MRYPYQVLEALRAALTECALPLAGSLFHDYTTNGEVSCVMFGGALLEKVAGSDANYDTVSSRELDPTSATENGAFFQFSVIGAPSDLNHVFCVYFWDNEAVIIQVFLNKKVKLITRISRPSLLDGLSAFHTDKAVEAYKALFGVKIDSFSAEAIYTTRVK